MNPEGICQVCLKPYDECECPVEMAMPPIQDKTDYVDGFYKSEYWQEAR